MAPIRLGIIGLGRWAEWLIQVIATMEQASVSAVCSRSRERALEIAQRYNVPNTHTDFHALVQDATVDAVIVATSEDRHCAPTLAAIEARKPVLVEKPIADTLEDADRMIQAAEKADVILLAGHTLRFDPRYIAIKDMIAAGQLGQLASLYATRNLPRERLLYRPTSLILRIAVHDIDIVLWYLGESPKEVCCMQSNVSNGPVADTNWILLRFPSGAIASVAVVALVPADAPASLVAALEVYGTKGVARIDQADQGVSLWTDESNRQLDLSFRAKVAGRLVGSLRNELSYFVECVTEGKKPDIATPEEARGALRVCLMALQSAISRVSFSC